MDPQFVGPADHDYSLQNSSPCIDAGDPDSVYNDPDGSRNDVGAIPYSLLGYLCGDTNNDEMVNVADAVYLINYIFKGGPAPEPFGSGNVNCDGQVNVADAVYLINYIFKNGESPCCF